MLYEIAHNAMCKDRSISCADSDVARVSFPVTSAGGFRNYPAGWLTGGQRAGGRADSFLGKLGSQACEKLDCPGLGGGGHRTGGCGCRRRTFIRNRADFFSRN